MQVKNNFIRVLYNNVMLFVNENLCNPPLQSGVEKMMSIEKMVGSLVIGWGLLWLVL